MFKRLFVPKSSSCLYTNRLRTSSLWQPISRTLFVVSLEYKVPIYKVEQHLEGHLAFLDNCYKENIFIASGRKMPRTGGVIIASIESKDKLEAIIKQDPFYLYDIASYHITEFIPTKYNEGFSKIAIDDLETTSKNKI